MTIHPTETVTIGSIIHLPQPARSWERTCPICRNGVQAIAIADGPYWRALVQIEGRVVASRAHRFDGYDTALAAAEELAAAEIAELHVRVCGRGAS